MLPDVSRPALHLVRLPGSSGPILRCRGELSVLTAEALRRELALLLPGTHAARGCNPLVLTVNLTDCRFIDVEGLLTLLHTYKELRQRGSRMALVAGTGRIARLLQATSIERIIPTFPTEETAAWALRGGGPPEPPPESWEAARAEAVTRWRGIQKLLEEERVDEALRPMTSMMALCDRAEALYQERPAPVSFRCEFCPLFHELGGQPEDVGCRSLLDPILAAVRDGDREQARNQVAEMIRLMETMPLSEGVEPPTGMEAPHAWQ